MYKCTGTNILFLYFHQSKQKSFSPSKFALAPLKFSGWLRVWLLVYSANGYVISNVNILITILLNIFF